jgi:hypothetical protein
MGAVAELVGVGRSTLSLMKKRGWRAVDYSASRRRLPNDFAIQARHMTHSELMEHYHAASRTVSRWMREKPVRAKLKPGPKATP